ncbi:hypothetical protein SASPL_141970 [Salvia splendens]|uniref:Uncharacterized protein n=1 Tax=Salvia splendens TaxID=180675 RepID=A0A8X8WJI1_SALSN|nr:hypothetical protein SASPL_141970 [Salvia splendens]
MQSRNASASLANLLQSCIDNKAYKAGKTIQAQIFRTYQFSNTFLVNRLIELYSKCGHTQAGRRLFDKMPHRNIFSYHAILDSYCKLNDVGNAFEVFDQMPGRNAVSWNLIISMLSRNGLEDKALAGYYAMRECHGIATKLGLNANLYVGNALLGMYMKCVSIEDAVMVFGDLPEHNEVSFTAMMEGLVGADRVDEAFDMFRLMHRERIIDCVSLSSVLSVCSKCEFGVDDDGNEGKRHVMHGAQIHGLLVKVGFLGDLHWNNSLLNMYAKLGCMDCAEILFNSLSQVSVVSWNVMIAGYAKGYHLQRVIECMERMQSCGVEPDEVTCVNMLAACLRSGDIETGLRIFNGMSVPSLASWNAMLSGYSQNGYHREAVMLFSEMQFRKARPDRTTFAIILSSCASMGLLEGGKQIHSALWKAELSMDFHSGLVDTGLKVFKSMQQEYDVEPLSDHYTCIVDTLGRAGRFNEVKEIIEKMPYKDDPIVWEVLLSSCRVHGNVNLARMAADELFRLDSGNSAPYSLLANMYSSLDRWDDVKDVRDIMGRQQVSKEPGYSWV